MKNLKKTLLTLFIIATFLLAGVSDIFARRSGGSRSFSRPRSTTSRTKSTSPSKTTKAKTSKRTTTAPKRSAAQQKSFEAAKKNGTSFKSKSDAQAAFKTANASKYTSKYTTQPATRPAHIPQSTTVGGKSVNVTYNTSMGGYGYSNHLGTWMMYDAMSDAFMMNALMRHNNYYYEPMNTSHRRVDDDRPRWQMYRHNKRCNKQNSKHKKRMAKYEENLSNAQINNKDTKSIHNTIDKENASHKRIISDIEADYPKAMRYIAAKKKVAEKKAQAAKAEKEMAAALKRLAATAPPATSDSDK